MTLNKTKHRLATYELDNVIGGTVSEYEDICKAFTKNSKLKDLAGIQAHIPGVNNGMATLLEQVMSSCLGIKAKIDLGWLGTGIKFKHNTYTDIGTGKSLSHQDVLNRISAY